MKVFLTAVLSLGLCVALVSAEDKKKEEKEAKAVTLKGTITCAKCDLKKEKACATVIVVKDKDDKEVIYYFDADGNKKHHKAICQEAKEGSVTGTVAEKDGKKTITVKECKFKE